MIRALVVEDDPVLADAHRTFVERVAGYTCAGVAHDGPTALRLIVELEVDVLLLDVGLPGMSGLDVLRAARSRALPVDVIVVSGERDLEVVRSAVSGGAVHYLLKPFTFAALRDKLERYAEYRGAVQVDGPAEQSDIDRALGTLRGSAGGSLPKGLSEDTLTLVARALQQSAEPLSAADTAAVTGVSRVTARRYLEHLAEIGRARRSPRYGAGRPENEYRPA